MNISTISLTGKVAITALGVLCSACTSTSVAPSSKFVAMAPVIGDERALEFRSQIQEMIESEELASLSIGVIENGEVVWAESFGWANRENSQRATLDTPYHIASMGKALTATAALSMVEDGLLSLYSTAPADLFSPLAPPQDNGPTLTQLLSMTGGVPHAAITYAAGNSSPNTQIDKQFALSAFPPGKTFHYSNMSIALVDTMMERASGKPYHQIMKEHVFGPLEMFNSGLDDHDGVMPASRYDEDANLIESMDPYPRSSRQLHASISDLLKYANYLSGKPMNENFAPTNSTLRDMQIRKQNAITDSHMALGIGSLTLNDGSRWIASSGNDWGAQSHLSIFPERNLAVVVLTNSSGYQADELAIGAAEAFSPGIAQLAVGAMRTFQGYDQEFEPDNSWAGSWQGVLKDEAGDIPVTLRIEGDGSLHASANGAPAQELDRVKHRNGLLTARMTAKLPLAIPPNDVHPVDFHLTWQSGELKGFAFVNYYSHDNKFEYGRPVYLRRVP